MPRSVMRLLPHLLWLAGVVGLAVALGLILSGTQGQQTAQAPEPTAVPLTTAQPAGTLPPGPFDSPIETPTPEATETVEPPPTSTVEPTPESTLVPTPTLILPTLTPMPRALGEILYLQYDANQKLLYRVPVDATGDAIAAPIPIEVSTGLANATYSAIGAIYPSPNRKIAAIISGVEAGHQVALYDFTTGQILPLL
jgi:hypothetical protein